MRFGLRWAAVACFLAMCLLAGLLPWHRSSAQESRVVPLRVIVVPSRREGNQFTAKQLGDLVETQLFESAADESRPIR